MNVSLLKRKEIMREKLSSEEMKAFKEWLGESGISFFRHLKGLKGTVIPVLRLNNDRKGMPGYPVHFREGMQVRNWLREHTKLGKTLNSIDLDDYYVKIIEEAIK